MHVHAKLIAQFAKDAMTTDKPGLLWEYYDGKWHTADEDGPGWLPNREYRRKPQTIQIGRCTVPAPMRTTPELGCTYYLFMLTSKEIEDHYWSNNHQDLTRFKAGLIHETLEGAEATRDAILELLQP